MFKDSEWVDYLPKITLAYNMCTHASTSYTPFYLFHGREGVCPLDLLTEIPVENEPDNVHEYALRQAEQLRYAFDYVQRHAQTRIQRMKKSYDAKVRPKVFSVGQLVYYFYPRVRKDKYHKWQANYLPGVYKVIRVLNSTNCILQRTPRSKAFVAHFDRLKHYLGETPSVWKDHKIPEQLAELRPNVDTGLSEPSPESAPKIVNRRPTPPPTKGKDTDSPPMADPDRSSRPVRAHRRPLRYQRIYSNC
jgi:hypothetical protein